MEELVKSAERLIKHLAYITHSRFLPYWELEDLVSEGYLAAVRSAKDFDKTKNVLFTTFAHSYVQRAFIDLRDSERRDKRSYLKQQKEDLSFIEKNNPIFPDRYKMGTKYRLDDCYDEVRGSEHRYASSSHKHEQHPILSESPLQCQPEAENWEVEEIINKMFDRLDAVSGDVLRTILCPPDLVLEKIKQKREEKEVRKNDGENVRGFNCVRGTYVLYAQFLGMSTYTFSKHLRILRELYTELTSS